MKNRELKFRVWDGEKILLPDLVDRYGFAHWLENSIPERSKVIMQYTGLLDCSKKLIYEGDFLEATHGLPLTGRTKPHQSKLSKQNKYKVVFGDGKFYITKSNSSRKRGLTSLLIRMSGLVVVGNIFENPEFKKGVTDAIIRKTKENHQEADARKDSV